MLKSFGFNVSKHKFWALMLKLKNDKRIKPKDWNRGRRGGGPPQIELAVNFIKESSLLSQPLPPPTLQFTASVACNENPCKPCLMPSPYP